MWSRFTGDLRIDYAKGLVEEAIAQAFNAPLDEVKEANMLLGDIDAPAVLAKITSFIGQSFRSSAQSNALASPEPTAEAIWNGRRCSCCCLSGRTEKPDARDGASIISRGR